MGRKRGQGINAKEVIDRVLREGADSLLTRGEAAALIADRVADRFDSVRTARNRVAMQLDRARARGVDVLRGGLRVLPDGRYTADEIVVFARCKYGADRFDDLPHSERGSMLIKLPPLVGFLKGAGGAEPLPQSLELCHARIQELVTKTTDLQAKVEKLTQALNKERAKRFLKK